MNKALKLTVVTVLAIFVIFMLYRSLFVKTQASQGAGIGMDAKDVTAANFRWELFAEWVKARPEYKGWESDSEIFKKANAEFREKVRPDVKVLR